MAHDQARQRIALFGGVDASAGPVGDTWEWDGATWVQQYPATSPSARASAMAYDAVRQRVMLFGGRNASTSPLGDTWEWDGGNWTQRNPVASPSPRSDHAMACDEARQRVVLFGGGAPSTLFADTWEWDGASWTQNNLVVRPSVRMDHAMAFDAARQRLVVYGGYDYGNWLTEHLIGDTWLYGNVVPAATQVVGSACAGTNGSPVLAGGIPSLGNQAFVLDLLYGRAAAPCLFVLATGTQSLPFPGGCTLYLAGVYVPFLTFANASGFASMKLAIPLDPSLRGTALHSQAVVLDPLGAFAGLAFSAGLRLVLGD
jgi:hypothetical protein